MQNKNFACFGLLQMAQVTVNTLVIIILIMLVHSMTEEEILNEINTDNINAMRYSDHYDNKFRRKVLKAKKFPVKSSLYYQSPRKNNWIILFEARNKKETGDFCRITFIAYLDSPHGFYAIMPTITEGERHLVFYPPHFFSRYANRCKIDLSGAELINHFFCFNASYVYGHIETGDSDLGGLYC